MIEGGAGMEGSAEGEDGGQQVGAYSVVSEESDGVSHGRVLLSVESEAGEGVAEERQGGVRAEELGAGAESSSGGLEGQVEEQWGTAQEDAPWSLLGAKGEAQLYCRCQL